MLITHEREKLLNAIIYFANKTALCGKTKIIKLLFLLDFEHFKQAGRSVTGLEYQAWRLGPVPPALFGEIVDPEPDFAEHIHFEHTPAGENVRDEVVPLKPFNPNHFTKRELRLMDRIATEYRDKNAEEMVGVTHAENGAWDKVYKGGRGRNDIIPYALALEGEENGADVLECAAESEEMRANFK